MPVSVDEVEWAYRLILGREPEAPAVVERLLGRQDRPALVREFLHSPEALSRPSAVTPIGLHMGVATNDVVTDATPDQRAAMLARIATAWRAFGESEPHWSVLTDPAFLQTSLGGNLERFYASGHDTVRLLRAALARNGVDETGLTRVVDFGCGVGRISLALAACFPRVTGVDISPAHIAHARARAAETGCDTVDFLGISSVEELDQLGTFDLFVSEIVLQHNPPPVIAAILEKVLGLLAPGGVARFQVPTYIAGFAFEPADYLATPQEPMEMNPLPQKDVFAIAAKAGCQPLEVREDGHTGDARMVSQTFLFRKTG